jgi:NAD(P)-dependent dehydrogenase (short-subunit alcohol dehydrogenase family)
MKKTVLITGAANGLGKALAVEFARNGWVVFAADIEPVAQYHSNIIPVQMDVTDAISIERAYATISEKTSHLNLLINNAGLFAAYPLSEVEFEELYRIYSVNTFGAFHVIRQFVPLLLPSKGRIVSISSESVIFPSLFQPYQATKIAMEALHRTIAQELYLKGIRMALIRPGAIRTRMTLQVEHLSNPVDGSMFDKEFGRFAAMAPRFRGRLLSPEVVASRIYRKVTCRHLRPVYRINNNPVLILISIIPVSWMNQMLKWQLARR